MRKVYSSLNRLLVHHAKNLLEAEGVHCLVLNENMAGAMGEVSFLDCEVQLWVREERDAARAERILAAGSTTAPAGPAWRCTCGEELDGQFTQCWNCGAARPL
jgi:hypothetical protein